MHSRDRVAHAERYFVDPRDDSPDDAALWEQLFRLAYELDGGVPGASELVGTLRGMRALGARLERAGPSYRIVPGPDLDPAEFAHVRRQWLDPHRARIARLLAKLPLTPHPPAS
jgi:hypothetical protein